IDDDLESCPDPDTKLDLLLEKLNLGARKKLLVLSLSGLLRVNVRDENKIPKSRTPDWKYANSLIYKRPFSGEFMKFCLERFEVGIWSSAMEHNVDAALDFTCGISRSQLLFVWDQDECTDSGFKSLEKKSKPLFFKELNEVWKCIKRGGPYSASNTLLIDDKPYKAFLNPPSTAIFPEPYKPEDKSDKALDPKGRLCSFLKGLADAEDVQAYVKDHPFGQPAITSSHPDWVFYSKVRSSLGKK
ncbi:uncharacterized protein LOC130724066, partial [Lotus japonicus]|uniref:uncharacterized protein LOC130724066 n=1 Tax=Lotus japonicus TaxID=34305 RepID=UPI002584A24B